MKSIYFSCTLVLFALVLFSCANTPEGPTEADKAAVLKLHNDQRDFHFNKDSVTFSTQFAFGDFLSVNRGEITSPSREETMARHHHYYSTVEFLKWDDVTDPVIRFSDDGSLAYTVVDKIVILKPIDQPEAQPDTTYYAWTTIYRKHDKDWKIECVTSTNK